MIYHINNGVLTKCEFGKNETVAIVPNTVRRIASGAFCSKPATSITLPDGVVELDAGAIEGCHDLAVVTLPYTIQKIAMGAIKYNGLNTIIRVPANLSYTNELALTTFGAHLIKY